MAQRRLRVKSKVWLEAVDELGSLARAARRLGMSYRAAWGLLKVTERALGVPLLVVRIGGHHGGGAALTREARELVRRFQRVKRQVNRAADRAFARQF